MSKNKQNKQDFDDFDDFDFDSEFSFDDDGGFNTTDVADGKRNAITRFVGGFVSGVKENLFTRKTVTELVDKSLPHSYQVALDGALDTADDVRDTVNTAYTSVEKSINDLRNQNRDQFGSIADGVPKALGDKIRNWANTSKGGYSGSQDQTAMEVGNELNAVFGAVTANATTQQTEALSGLMETSATQSKLMTGSNDLLSSINTSIAKLTQYQDTVGISFQRKMLETSLHQLFVQRKHLERVNKHYDFIEKAVPTLIQNTGLPDFVKIQQSEMVRQQMANRFVGQLSDTMYANIAGIRGRIFRKMQKSIKDATQQISGTGGMLVSALADTINPGFGSGGKADMATLVGQFLANGASERATKFVGEQVKSMIAESPELQQKIGDGDHLLQMMRARLPGYMNDRLLSGNTGNKFVDGVSGIFGLGELKLRRKESIQNSIYNHLNDPAVFTLRTQRAITEVIPGLLSRIHMEVHKSNGGNPKSPLQYDWDKGGFTTVQDYTERLIEKRVATGKRAEEIVEQDNALLKNIDPKQELSGKTRAKIAEYVMLAGVKGEDISLSYFIDPGSKLYIKELAQHVKRKYDFELESGDSNDLTKVFKKFAKGNKEVSVLEKHIAEARNISAQRFDDPLKELLDIANKMDIAELAKYDFITVGRDGNYSIDYKKYLDYQRGHHANITGKKAQRAPFVDKNEAFSPFDVSNAFDKVFHYSGTVAPNGSGKIKAGGTPSYWRRGDNDSRTSDYFNGVLLNDPSTYPDIFGPIQPTGRPTEQPSTQTQAQTPSVNPATPTVSPQSHIPKNTIWTRAKNLVSNNYGKLMLGTGSLMLPSISNAMTTAGDMALNGVTVGDGGTLALVMGGAAGATYLAAKVGEKIKRARANVEEGTLDDDDETDDDNKKTTTTSRLFNRRRSNLDDRTRGEIISSLNRKAFAKTEKLLDFILKRNTEGFNQLHEDFGMLIESIKEATVSGVFAGDFRFDFLSRMWGGAKKLGSSVWEKGGKFLKWKFGLYKKLYEKTKWLREKAVEGSKKAWEYLKDRKENIQEFLGKGLEKGWEGAKWLAKSPWEFGKYLLGDKENPGIARRGWRKVKELGGQALDMAGSWRDGIYLQGEDFPRLDAIGLRAGKYRDEATGKVIKKLSDITGNVIDEYGVVVLSKDQILQGLYDRHGYKLGDVSARIKGLIESTTGLGKSTVDFLVSMPFRAAGWMLGKAKSLKDRLDKFKQDKNWSELLKFGALTNSGKQLEELIRIRELIEKRYKSEYVFGDSDGDGDRDGSLRDVLEERENKKQKEEQEKKEKEKEKKAKGKSDEESMPGLFSKLGGVVKGFLGTFTGTVLPIIGKVLVTAAATAIPALVTSMAIPAITNFFKGDQSKQATSPDDPRLNPNSDAYDPNVKEATATQKLAAGAGDAFSELPWWGKLIAGYGVYRGAKWGLKKAGGLALKAGGLAAKGLWTAGKWGVTKALPFMVAKGIALGKGALTLGASLMASPLAPIVGAVAATAAVGYVGYKLWKGYKKNETPMLRIRMASYGYDVHDEDHVPKLLEVETILQKYLRKNNNNTYTLDKTLTRETLYPLFNVNPEDPEQKATWEKYFYYRFLPVFITFVNCLASIRDVPVDVTKMDDNLSYQQMLLVCNDSMISKKELNPYDVKESGFSGERKVDLDQEEVFDIYASVKKSLDKKVRRGKVNQRQKQRRIENDKLDKEIKKEDKKLSDLLTRHGYNADAILKNPVSRLFGENVVTKAFDVLANAVTAPVRAVGRAGEYVANKIGLSDSLAGSPATSKSGIGGFFSGLIDSFLGRGGQQAPQPQPTGGMGVGGGDTSFNIGGATSGGTGAASWSVKGNTLTMGNWKRTVNPPGLAKYGPMIARMAKSEGLDPAIFLAKANIESTFNPSAQNTYYGGLFAIDKRKHQNWANPEYNTREAIKLYKYNKAAWEKKFPGDVFTPGKAYLMHQQGVGGGAGLYANRNNGKSAAQALKENGWGGKSIDWIKRKVIKSNGGDPNWSAGQFASFWMNRADALYGYYKGSSKGTVGSDTPADPVSQPTASTSNTASGVAKSAAASNPAGAGVLKPDTNVSYKDAKIDKMKQSTSGGTQIMNDIGVPVPQSKPDNTKLPISGDSRPAKAARYARKEGKKASMHKCALYVRIALQKGGYPIVPKKSAYMYHSTEELKRAGFVQIHVGTRWQVGDVLVVNRTKNNVHGHIQIWDGSNWVSDFIQNKIVKYRDGDGFAMYRDKDYLNGAVPYNGGWQPYAQITGSNGTTSLPASGATGEALGPVGMVSSGKKFTKREITSMDIVHGRIKTKEQAIPADTSKDKEPASKTDASLGKDDKGKKQSDKLAKDTAVTVNKKSEAVKTGGSSTTNTKPKSDPKAKSPEKPKEKKPDSKVIHPNPKQPEPISKKDSGAPSTPTGVKPGVDAARQQRKQEEEAKQQAMRNEHMLRIMTEDKNILEKQLSVQLNMLNELRTINQSIKNLQITSPIPSNKQGANKPIEPTRPPAPDTIIEPVSMLKS